MIRPSSPPPAPPSSMHSEIRQCFRQYDVRGIISTHGLSDDVHVWPESSSLSTTLAFAIGCAYAAELAEEIPEPDEGWWVAIGYDARLSGPHLVQALEAGLRCGGINVYRLGLVPTPVVYFATHHLNHQTQHCHGGIVVTGSHNPSDWNGFKMSVGHSSIYGSKLQRLADRILTADFTSVSSSNDQVQTRGEDLDLSDDYLAAVHERLRWGNRPLSELKVVLDPGNGAAGPLAARLFSDFGVQLTCINVEPNGLFPAHHPDPTVEENLCQLREEVARTDADVGIGFDGDGDRVGVIDREGNVIWGDQLLLLFAESILKRTPHARIIGEVKCSQLLYDGIRKLGGQPEMWRVGHSLIKARMAETGAPLAGEMSGHIFFADRFYGHDDALYVAARLLERLSEPGFDLSVWRRELPHVVNTPELRVWCADSDKPAVISRVLKAFSIDFEVNDIDGARIQFPEGWGLVRASNTQPVLVMRFEAYTESRLNEIKQHVEEWLRDYAPEVCFDLDPNH